jgi:hypothetical protein
MALSVEIFDINPGQLSLRHKNRARFQADMQHKTS